MVGTFNLGSWLYRPSYVETTMVTWGSFLLGHRHVFQITAIVAIMLTFRQTENVHHQKPNEIQVNPSPSMSVKPPASLFRRKMKTPSSACCAPTWRRIRSRRSSGKKSRSSCSTNTPCDRKPGGDVRDVRDVVRVSLCHVWTGNVGKWLNFGK